MTQAQKYQRYLEALKHDFLKLCKLEFLQPDGSVAFTLDNNPKNKRSRAFIQEGSISCNLQNGARRTATVTLSNLDDEYSHNINTVWFGQQVRISEGLVLTSGEAFYLPQGVFYIKDPEESHKNGAKMATFPLVDKWAYLDGSLFGNLDGVYVVPGNSNMFDAIRTLLLMPRGNGQVVDNVTPVFTDYYNGMVTELMDGSVASNIMTPYEYRCDGDGGTYAEVILAINAMLVGWIGYDQTGRLRLDPSQDDILDIEKPVLYNFTPLEKQFLGRTYVVKKSEMYNDIIVQGESLDNYAQPAARATNYDASSDTNANIVGLKTKRHSASGYYSEYVCESLASFMLKRMTVLQKSVTIEATQMFHLVENNLVTIRRTDKAGSPVERHLLTGFTRPLAQTGPMTLQATSVQDFPIATMTKPFQ